MQRLVDSNGIAISYQSSGCGPGLVLVHGGFSDHHTNWEFVEPQLAQHYTLWAIARRGRGETTATRGHRLEDEARDVVTVIRSLEQPVYLLGHSYGAQVALAAALELPERIRGLILYEPASSALFPDTAMQRLEDLAAVEDWDGFALAFFGEMLLVPPAELAALRASDLWPPIVADAPATLQDLRALRKYDFRPDRFRGVQVPVVLQVGTESPRELYATDALAAVLPNVRIQELPGQAHEGMTTAPDLYVAAVHDILQAA